MSARTTRRGALALALLLLVAAAASCAHAPPAATGAGGRGPIEPDSITVGLWHLDESTGRDVADSGPFKLHGAAGVDTRPQYGRYGQGRLFTRSVNSFVQVPANPLLDGEAGFTVEAWIFLNRYADYTDCPIVGRWSPAANEQGWLFTVVGRRLHDLPAGVGIDRASMIGTAEAGRLMFAFQPGSAGVPRVFLSARTVPVERWMHVAVTYDREIVRIWVNGLLDAQFISPGRIMATETPLLIGNTLDPHTLTTFGGLLRVDPSADPTPYFAFDGAMDDVRISSRARAAFPYAQVP